MSRLSGLLYSQFDVHFVGVKLFWVDLIDMGGAVVTRDGCLGDDAIR